MELINVHIGEAKIGSHKNVLCALLGSCVGIGIVWEQKKMCGLAHCLLSEAPPSETKKLARYIEHAIPLLMRKLGASPEDYPNLKAFVAGGANMTLPNDSSPEKLVGLRNVDYALKALQKIGVNVESTVTGGVEGRRMFLYGSTGEMQVKSIPKASGE